jgi:hypothetical protein
VGWSWLGLRVIQGGNGWGRGGGGGGGVSRTCESYIKYYNTHSGLCGPFMDLERKKHKKLVKT